MKYTLRYITSHHAVDLGSAMPTDTSSSSRLTSSAVEVWYPAGRTGSIPDSTLFSFSTSSPTAKTRILFGGQRSAVPLLEKHPIIWC